MKASIMLYDYLCLEIKMLRVNYIFPIDIHTVPFMIG